MFSVQLYQSNILFLKHVAHVYMFDSYCTRIAFSSDISDIYIYKDNTSLLFLTVFFGSSA